MSLLPDLLAPERILLDVAAASKQALYEVVGQRLAETLKVSAKTITASLLAREKLGSTGLGQGVAIPHGRIKGLKQATGCFLRLKEPISFGAPDNQPVSLVFVLLVPEQATELHLRILSELASRLGDKAFRDQLAQLADPVAIHRLFIHAPD
ncbi:PTS sugar transporter subunit IIA [Thiobacter aerophilum]|uniref:PTS sugar transporter subunit IIA n=1 Tax=Thiobacter aerophilum TaxID=3121275 RepID=A0ABV0EFL2_9BURK